MQTKNTLYIIASLSVAAVVAFLESQLVPVYGFGIALFVVLFIIILIIDNRDRQLKEDVMLGASIVIIVFSWISFTTRDDIQNLIYQLRSLALRASEQQAQLQSLNGLLPIYNVIGTIVLSAGLVLGLFCLWSWLECNIVKKTIALVRKK